jgi:molybdopterin converting factor small subunit
MSVKMNLHPFLNDGVELQLEIEGKTVGECLNNVIKRYPAMEKKLFAKKGGLKGYVEIVVNSKSAYPNELIHPVNNDDVVSVLVFLAGG